MSLVRFPKAICYYRRIVKGISSTAPTMFKVNHDPQKQEFYISLGENDKAVLQYTYVSTNEVDLEHTVVPSKYRGQGIAQHLAEAAMGFVIENNFKMKLSCTYLQKYVKDNPLPEYTSRMVK